MRDFGAIPPVARGNGGPPPFNGGGARAVPPPLPPAARAVAPVAVPVHAPVAAPVAAPDGLAAAIAAAVASYLPAPAPAAAALDEAAIRAVAESAAREAVAAVLAEAEAARPTVRVEVGAASAVTVDGPVHEAFPRVLALAAGLAEPRNVMMVGPAGCGKTSLGASVAAALGLPFDFLSLSGGTSESAIVGRTIPNLATGDAVREETAFVRCYRDGGVFLFDEVDAADSNVLVAVNAALANGHLALPGGVTIPRHPGCVILAAANTYGTGADRQYVGRNQLDAATLDRFAGAVVDVDYSPAIERGIAASYGAAGARALAWTCRTRGAVQAAKLRRIVSTRALIACARHEAVGAVDAFLVSFASGWTAPERAAAGLPAAPEAVNWTALADRLPR